MCFLLLVDVRICGGPLLKCGGGVDSCSWESVAQQQQQEDTVNFIHNVLTAADITVTIALAIAIVID